MSYSEFNVILPRSSSMVYFPLGLIPFIILILARTFPYSGFSFVLVLLATPLLMVASPLCFVQGWVAAHRKSTIGILLNSLGLLIWAVFLLGFLQVI